MSIKLNTGNDVSIEIEFEDRNESVFINFNPSDPDIAKRLEEFSTNVTNKTQDLSDLELDNNGELIGNASIAVYNNYMDIIKQELDNVFKSNVSDKIFKYCSPFAIVGDEYYIVQFMNAITPEIKKHIEKANKKAHNKMKKHLDKYAK